MRPRVRPSWSRLWDRAPHTCVGAVAPGRYRLERAPAGAAVKVLTAPSGYAFDLFGALERTGKLGQGAAIEVVAGDLDPDGRIEGALAQATRRAGAGLTFLRGDLTTAALREQFERAGPYDVALFVGLSCWIAKPNLLRHLRLIRERLLRPGGALIADCFTPGAFALSGKYIGYKANYYAPREFSCLLAYCGFDPARVVWESEGINRVCIISMPKQPGEADATVDP
jgi:SAM-dependent methyltransferase